MQFQSELLTASFQHCHLVFYSSTHFRAIDCPSNHGNTAGSGSFLREITSVDAVPNYLNEQSLLHPLSQSEAIFDLTTCAISEFTPYTLSEAKLLHGNRRLQKRVSLPSGKHSGEKELGLRWNWPVFNEVRKVKT